MRGSADRVLVAAQSKIADRAAPAPTAQRRAATGARGHDLPDVLTLDAASQ